MCVLMCINVRIQNLKVYRDTLLIIQTHIKENKLVVESSRRYWLEEPFVVLGTNI